MTHDDHSHAWIVCAVLWLAAWAACLVGAVVLWRVVRRYDSQD